MKTIVPVLACGLFLVNSLCPAGAQDLFAPWRIHAQAEDIRTEGQLDQKIRVTFESYFGGGVDVTTLSDGDILVTGPGYEQRGTLVSVENISPQNDEPDPNVPGGGILPKVVVATYQVLPSLVHDGPWSTEQNGAYSIQLRQGEVSDSNGTAYPPILIGSFRVALGDNGGGVPVLPFETNITITGGSPNGDPILPPEGSVYSALVELQFSEPNVEVQLTSFLREGNTFVANFEAVSYPGDGEVFPAVIHVHSEILHLGPLEAGDYRFVVRSRNQRLALKEFTVGGTPGDNLPPEATATAEPVTEPGSTPHLIRVVYEDSSGVDMSSLDSADLLVQDANRCVLHEPNAAGEILCFEHSRLAVELVEAAPTNNAATRVAAVYSVLPPPDGWTAAANGNYQILVALQEVCDIPGNCTAQRVIGELIVAIQPTPNANLSVDASDPGNVTAKVILSLPPQHVVVETSVTVEGGRIFLDATALPTPGVPDENAAPRTETLTFDIGSLATGSYHALFRLNGAPLDAESFVIEGDPGPVRPNIAFINVQEGNAAHFAEVGVILERPDHVVLDWGQVRQEGERFFVEIIVGPGDPAVNEAGDVPVIGVPGRLVTHRYPLGVLDEGAYVFNVTHENEVIESHKFRIDGPPDPIPPHVAFIKIEEGNASHFAQVGIVLDRPGIGVVDWGEVRREENRFFVEITLGPVDATVDPNVPPAELPDGWDAAIGGFPFQLVTHAYPLGVLESGEYIFAVTSGDSIVARQPFAVGGAGPIATLSVDDIEEAKEGAHQFSVGFHGAQGLNHESIQNAAVTVRGPDGFEASAELESYIPSLDPLGIAASATYAITAPGGTWDEEDSGSYRIFIDASAVLDRAGNALARDLLGGFQVRILPEPPEPPGRVEITTRLENGIWLADVDVNDTSVSITDWGDDLIRHGRSILALATASPADPNAAATDNSHTYRIGELSPGFYVFVFKTDLAHCGIARIHVPGLGDGGFNGWLDWMRGEAADAAGNMPVDFGAYAFAFRPREHAAPEVEAAVFVGENGSRHGGIRFRRLHGAADVEFVVQCSRDMAEWQDAGDLVEIIGREIDIDGTEIVHVCLVDALGESEFPFLRVVARQIES